MTERVKIPSCCLRTGVRRAVYFLPTLSLSARMRVPKLVCEVPYASDFVWFVCVEGGLGCE